MRLLFYTRVTPPSENCGYMHKDMTRLNQILYIKNV